MDIKINQNDSHGTPKKCRDLQSLLIHLLKVRYNRVIQPSPPFPSPLPPPHKKEGEKDPEMAGIDR